MGFSTSFPPYDIQGPSGDNKNYCGIFYSGNQDYYYYMTKDMISTWKETQSRTSSSTVTRIVYIQIYHVNKCFVPKAYHEHVYSVSESMFG